MELSILCLLTSRYQVSASRGHWGGKIYILTTREGESDFEYAVSLLRKGNEKERKEAA